MNSLFFRSLLVVGGVFILTGCQQSKGPIVAQVGHNSISVEDFSNRLHDTPAQYQQYVATPEGRRQFLNLLIREKVLLAEARKSGMQHQEDYRKAEKQYAERINRQKRDYEESLLIEMYIAKLRAKDLTIPDADVRSYFDAHEADFTHPVEVQASHILVNSEADAQQVLARLKSGESFETLAKTLSMDPATAAQGGRLAPYTRGSLVPEFEDAVAHLHPGETSGIVKTSFGYHIIRKIGEKKLPGRTFDLAKEDIRNHLQRDKFDQWVTKEQASLGVKIDEKALATVTMAPAMSTPGLSQESVQ